MRLFDLIKLSLKNIRTKSSIIIILLVTISAFSTIFGISFRTSFNKYWDDYVKKNIDFRIYGVSYERLKDEQINNQDVDLLTSEEKVAIFNKAQQNAEKILSGISHIDGVTTSDGYMADIINFEYNGTNLANNMYLIGVPKNTYINIVKGNMLSDYSDNEKTIICSNRIQKGESNNDEFNIENIIGKNVKLTLFDGRKIDYKVVGVYDKVSTYAIGNSCYTSYTNVKEILSEQYKKDIEVNSKSPGYYGESLYVMIDDRSNINYIDEELKKYDMTIEPIIMIDTEILQQVINTCSYISFFTFIFAIIVVFFNIMINIKEKNKIYYIYNITGYSKYKIMLINIFENGIIGIVSFISAVVLSLISFRIFNNIVLSHNVRLYLFNQQLDVKCICFGLLISFIIPVLISIVFMINDKLIKNNVLE